MRVIVATTPRTPSSDSAAVADNADQPESMNVRAASRAHTGGPALLWSLGGLPRAGASGKLVMSFWCSSAGPAAFLADAWWG